MKRLVVAALAAFFVFGAGSASAVEMVVIKYRLGLPGSSVANALGFTSPVYGVDPIDGGAGTSSPHNTQQPTGSMVTFRFNSINGNPRVSGPVVMQTFILSAGNTFSIGLGQNVASGYTWNSLNASITGGHLKSGGINGDPQITGGGSMTPNGGTATQSTNGFFHCLLLKGGCAFYFGLKQYQQTNDIGYGAGGTTGGAPPAWTPNAPNTNGPATFNPGGGFWQITPNGGLITGNVPFLKQYTLTPGSGGFFILKGDEIGRTVIPMPEPAALPLLVLGIAGAGGLAIWARRRRA